MSDFFKGIEPVPFKGPDTDDPFWRDGPDGKQGAIPDI